MTFETDITGYGRKMGLNACGNGEGRLNGVHYLGVQGEGTSMPAGTITYRTVNAASGESSGGAGTAGNAWGTNRLNNVSGSGQPQLPDSNYPRN
mgnify:CR=1 FL=1